jgi:hypothetical protein
VARQKNSVDTIQITLSVTPAIRDFLDQLSRSGFFGKNAAETASELLKEKLRDLSTRPGTPGLPQPGYHPTWPVNPAAPGS